MSGIYLDENVRLKSHSALTKGGKSTIKIELETAGHFDLASILRQLDAIDQAQREASKPTKRTSRAPSRQEQLKIAAPLLQPQDHRERDT